MEQSTWITCKLYNHTWWTVGSLMTKDNRSFITLYSRSSSLEIKHVVSRLNMKRAININLLPRLITRGAASPNPHLPTWYALGQIFLIQICLRLRSEASICVRHIPKVTTLYRISSNIKTPANLLRRVKPSLINLLNSLFNIMYGTNTECIFQVNVTCKIITRCALHRRVKGFIS